MIFRPFQNIIWGYACDCPAYKVRVFTKVSIGGNGLVCKIATPATGCTYFTRGVFAHINNCDALSTADGKIKGTATTDANGCYAFIGLHKPSADAVVDPAVPYPEDHYTLTVQAEGYADVPAQTVTVESHVDEPTRAAKQAAWDEAHKGDKPGEGEAAPSS